MSHANKFLFLTSLLFFLVSCGGDGGDNYRSVFDVVSRSDDHSTLETAIETAGLEATLNDSAAEFTIFAPTDTAFEALGVETITALLADPDALTNVLLYHVLDFEADAADVLALPDLSIEMLNGDRVTKGLEGGDLYLNFALVVETDLSADNGVVHVIDAVLVPSDLTPGADNIVDTAINDGRFTSLVTALQATGLDANLADENERFTVFAPTDDAFAMLPAGVFTALAADTDTLSEVLLQHVIADAEVDLVTALSLDGMMAATAGGALIDVDVDFSAEILSVGGANVIISNLVTSNGIIHVIDTVITGDVDLPEPSLVDVARESGYSSLVSALEESGLDLVLADLDENFTVFAPSDEAFAALGQATLDALFADPDALSDILLYHVIAEATILSDAALAVAAGDDSTVTTAVGADIGLSSVSASLFVNTAEVAAADIMATNGVIHEIDQVLIPPSEPGTPTNNIVETAVAAGNFTTLVSLLQATSLDTVLANEAETFTVFAPTDAAFALIPSATLMALGDDLPTLEQVLLQHVIADVAVDSVTAFTLNGTNVETASSVDGSDVTIEIIDGVFEVQGSAVSVFDIYTTNGIIHVIDAVITETLN